MMVPEIPTQALFDGLVRFDTKDSRDRRPRIAILMPMVWGLRNVVHSGVLASLARSGVEVHLLMKEFNPGAAGLPGELDLEQAAGIQGLIKPARVQPVKGRSFLKAVLFSAFSRSHAIGSYFIYQKWYGRSLSPGQRAKRGVIEILGTLASHGRLLGFIDRFYDRVYRSEHDFGPLRQQLEAIRPDLIWSTVNVNQEYERGYVDTARELGIPIVTSILSFDNLTSKPSHLLYDHYLVWSDMMKEELLRFYPSVKPENVIVTGTPQFDFHLKPEYRWSRSETLAALELQDDTEYFVYTCSHEDLAPAEPDLVVRLAERLRGHPDLSRFRLVVRTHPLDDWRRWADLESRSDIIRLTNAWSIRPDQDGWALVDLEEQSRFVSTLLHAHACINIASTTTLDAAILNRPVIGLRFDHEPDAPREILYEEYDTDHYRPLVASGGFRIAHSWDNLEMLLLEAASDDTTGSDLRKNMVQQVCGQVDGRAAERVSQQLLCLLKVND